MNQGTQVWTPATTAERLMVKFASHDPAIVILAQRAALYKQAAEGADKPEVPANAAQKDQGTQAAPSNQEGTMTPAATPAPKTKPAPKAKGNFMEPVWNWLGKNNASDPWGNAKDIGVGGATALLTHMATAGVPGLRNNRLLRLLLSLGVGTGAWYFGQPIRQGLDTMGRGISTKFNSLRASAPAPAPKAADKPAAPAQPQAAPVKK